MNAEIKTKWVNALRSGKYKQGKNVLRDDENDCFCSLGVLCDIVMPEGWNKYSDTGLQNGMHLGSRTYPETEILQEAGLNDYQCKYLTNMNDLDNRTFVEIADYIEKNL
jgi:hypothetical protein